MFNSLPDDGRSRGVGLARSENVIETVQAKAVGIGHPSLESEQLAKDSAVSGGCDFDHVGARIIDQSIVTIGPQGIGAHAGRNQVSGSDGTRDHMATTVEKACMPMKIQSEQLLCLDRKRDQGNDKNGG